MKREIVSELLARMTEYERELWGKGEAVAGIDEAGRGPLCGPVAAACVIPDPDSLVAGVNDSKKLSDKKRRELYPLILERSLYVGLGWADNSVIDDINILNATKKAMREAALGAKADVFLIDAVKGLELSAETVPIIHGDSLSYSIAAASIVAKVARDDLMLQMDEMYPGYGFKSNKGYGTKEHIEAIKKYGPTPIHRMTFIQKFIGDKE